jgi:hypothetical protein
MRRYLLACVVFLGLAVLAVVVGDRVRLRLWRNDIHSDDSAIRGKALYKVGKEREGRAVDDVLSVLAEEQDREVLEHAGYAAMRLGDERGIGLLQRRSDQGSDDGVRGRLMFYAARLSRPFDLRLADWMSAGINSTEPWRRAGSVLGMLELGDPEGGRLMIEYARVADPEVRKFLLDQFRRIADAMAEAIGQTIDWPSQSCGPENAECWAGLQGFWERHATEKLLNDVLVRLEVRDPKWYEVNRLLHARDKITAWFD